MMQPRSFGLASLLLLLLCVGGGSSVQEIQPRHHNDLDFSTGARTFLFGKLVLVPVLAAIGLKFLALLPIVLSKIALLSVMNFLSTNLNLLVSTLFGLKNFLGKHGLWAQEDVAQHPDIQTFAEFANQPFTMQPSFRYQYLWDQGQSLGLTATKAPKVLKVISSTNGYGVLDSGSGSYKFGTLDRRTRANNSRRQFLKLKEQKSNERPGKYKCYWTSAAEDTAVQLGVTANSAGQQEEVADKRKFVVTDTSRIPSNELRSQLNSYADWNNEIVPTMESYAPLPNFYDYGSASPVYHRQVATHESAEKSDDSSGIRERQRLPFTASQVKVPENYGDAAVGQVQG